MPIIAGDSFLLPHAGCRNLRPHEDHTQSYKLAWIISDGRPSAKEFTATQPSYQRVVNFLRFNFGLADRRDRKRQARFHKRPGQSDYSLCIKIEPAWSARHGLMKTYNSASGLKEVGNPHADLREEGAKCLMMRA